MLPTNPLLNATAPAGPHLPTATLRQYAAGTLAPAAQHRVEAHTLACPRCADILEGLLQTNATTTDQALAQLSQRLRHRVLLAESTRSPARTRTKHRWLVPQLAAAATLLFGLLAGGWWTWQQRHPEPGAAGRPVATAPSPSPPVAGAPAAPAPSAAAAAAAATATTPPLAEAHPRHVATLQRRPQRLSTAKHLTQATAKPTPPAARPSAPVAAAPEPVASPPPVAVAPAATAPADSAAPAKRLTISAAPRRVAEPEAARVRVGAMPAAAVIPPTPMGGYAAWREQLRHGATEFKPELPDRPLSGTVRLRLLIGADGKIQEIRVLRGIRADYDEEAQRLVCDGPAWVPGIGSGKRAAQAVEVAVPFYND